MNHLRHQHAAVAVIVLLFSFLTSTSANPYSSTSTRIIVRYAPGARSAHTDDALGIKTVSLTRNETIEGALAKFNAHVDVLYAGMRMIIFGGAFKEGVAREVIILYLITLALSSSTLLGLFFYFFTWRCFFFPFQTKRIAILEGGGT